MPKASSLIVISGVIVLALSARADGISNTTTTTLNLSSNTVLAGTAVTLTATVAGSGSPVTQGQVNFCNATAAYCDGAALFGVAEVTGAHTASITLILGVGSYSIQAVFTGDLSAAGSASTAQTLTITGAANYISNTQIALSGSVGDYTLTATVAAFGRLAPAGTVSFLDTSNADAVVAAAALNVGTLTSIFFQSQDSPITSETAVQFVATGDFNNDGIPDLAIVNSIFNGTVAVLLGNGNGTFQPSIEYDVGEYPNAVAVADVNHDGNLDLICVNKGSGTVSVLLGNGNGTFQSQITAPTGDFPSFVAVGDFNRDGLPDLALPNYLDGTVSVLLGNGDGTFQPQVTYDVGANPTGVAIGDFNLDGLQDLAVSNTGGGTASILLGNGDGTFQPQQLVSLPNSSAPYWLAAGDLRRDGRSDLVVPDSASSNVYVLLSNGDATFQPAVAYALPAAPFGVSLADINGDSVLDLVVADTGADGLISILLGNGNGTFGASNDRGVGNLPTWAAVADLNGDGMADIVSANSGPSTATILLQAQTETATAAGVGIIGTGTHNVLASYPGDADRRPSVSPTVALIATQLTSTTTGITAAPNPALAGQPVTLTATVSPAPTGASLGTVSFYNSSVLLDTASINASGLATFTTSTLPPGGLTLTAVYSGNAAFAGSTSAAWIETVNTTYTVTASPASITAAQGATIQFNVSVPPFGGAYNHAVNLSATGLPPGASAVFFPAAAVTPGSAGAQIVLTIYLAQLNLNASESKRKFPLGYPLPASLAVTVSLCGAGFGGKRSFGNFRRSRLLALAVLAFCIAGLGSCDGGFTGPPTTPPGSYTVTITGTSGSLSASATVMVVVR
jgi:Bacterial Ig-like domain (group 3)/FG-GAP-like repeat/FG-GAP repeat